jgi:hypothetical protein
MPDVIRAIDFLMLPLINVINLFNSDENNSTLFILLSIFATFYFAPPPFRFKGACTFKYRHIQLNFIHM